ncbi:Vesicle-fusing ATPase [Camellia lanceoleosa]|uniref:Vesicle-fusing ATPase n=1 Tax=Camellia lanceoleosa TaxID=1840588 RepID=A0ACC0HSL5_9ERIC|nr:Vesicle-fusing ATPase [Camellia lanceoleosa]
MASSSSAPFVVVEHTSSEQCFTNLCYCCPDDTRQFAVSLQRGPPWPFTAIQKKKKLYLALFNGKNVFSIQYPPKKDEKVAKGHISLNPEHCKSLDVSFGDTILLQVFAPPPNGFDVDVLRIMVELLPESLTPTQMITASTLGREFKNTFHHQVFTEYQRVVFAYKGSSYACNVVEISLGENEGSESLRSTKQGMIRKRTKVIVEVPTQSLGTLIHGAETLKNIFREGFNMESLEEELISLGIGGMTSQFAQILQSAFGSRMVPPSQARRLNLKHVRGMLLYGPPGSGKTLIARNICKLLNAKEPLIIHGPDVLNAFQGVSERKIRSLFEAANEDENRYGAKSDLHIIIFDEIDSIAKKRGVAMGQHHMDDRLVNQLLTMIDGMEILNNIFIIATTNRKELIDEALLREGRIELHIKLEYPDERGRLQILDINTRNMRQAFVLDEDVNLQEIACRMDGCSGAAIASLVTRAHSYAVVQAGEGGLVKRVQKDVKVTMNHFFHAIEDIKSRLHESSLEPHRMEKQEMRLSSSYLTEVLHIQQDIARLKEDRAHFQATLASYKEDIVKLEKELETLRCALDRMLATTFLDSLPTRSSSAAADNSTFLLPMEMLYLVLLATVAMSDVAELVEERYFRQRSLTLALETNLRKAAMADLRKGR